MVTFRNWINSSIGKKQIVGFTGLGISFFAFSHMAGNLLMFFSPKAYNMYGHTIVSNPLFPVIELVLLAAFLTHIGFTMNLVWLNRRARPVRPFSNGTAPKASTFAARTMALSGLLLLVFLVLHIWAFKYGPYYTVVYDGEPVRDLYRLLVEKFQDPLFVAWYLLSLAVLGLHLSHGLGSTLQSLGFVGARHPWLRKISWTLAVVIAGGFFIQPIWIYCCVGGNS